VFLPKAQTLIVLENMPATRKSKSSKPATNNVYDSIVSAYIEQLLTEGSKPVSIYELTRHLKIEEQAC
jgi:hypothetical protein